VDSAGWSSLGEGSITYRARYGLNAHFGYRGLERRSMLQHPIFCHRAILHSTNTPGCRQLLRGGFKVVSSGQGESSNEQS
jgi:hypothetical protein